MKTSRLVWFIQQFYMIVYSSVMFWVNLFRGFVVMGICYSIEKTFCYLRGTHYDKYRDRTKAVKIRFSFSNLLLIFTLGVFVLTSRLNASNLTIFLLVVSLAYFLLILVYVIFKSYYQLNRFIDVMEKMMESWSLCLYALMLSLLAVILSGVNIIWLVLLIPGVLSKMMLVAFKRLEKREVSVNE